METDFVQKKQFAAQVKLDFGETTAVGCDVFEEDGSGVENDDEGLFEKTLLRDKRQFVGPDKTTQVPVALKARVGCGRKQW